MCSKYRSRTESLRTDFVRHGDAAPPVRGAAPVTLRPPVRNNRTVRRPLPDRNPYMQEEEKEVLGEDMPERGSNESDPTVFRQGVSESAEGFLTSDI